MKKLSFFSLTFLFLLLNHSEAFAQDVVSVVPQHDPNYGCQFNFTFTNHNLAQNNIDQVRFILLSGNGITLNPLNPPQHWTENSNGLGIQENATSDNGGIKPNASLGGFLLDYIDNVYETPVTVKWVTLNATGTGLDSGTVDLICTIYQSFNIIDTATAIPSQSGPDPCFSFTFINRNLDGGQTNSTKYLSFQLLRPTDGTLRPSKITPAPGWILDSVTTYTAYFHTDNAPLGTNGVASGFNICLRGNPNSTKFSFVWEAFNDAGYFYDRDTIRDIPNTASGAPNNADSVYAVAQPNSCLYNVTVKDYHITNLLPPSRIVKLILISKTAGITFSAVPNLPAAWNMRISAASDSIIYSADSIMAGIGGGVVSSDFSFVVAGPTTSPFTIGWETDQPGSPFPPKSNTISTGSLNLSCTPAIPATDSVFVNLKGNCVYQVTLKNAHNIKPASNLLGMTLSIPSGSGQITGTLSTANWSITNVSPTLVKFQGDDANSMKTGDAQDFTFTFAPKTQGASVDLTWSTFDAAGISSGTSLYTGTDPISCTQSVIVCDTVVHNPALISIDSCVNTFTLHNRKTTDIMSLLITPTNGWKIDTANTPTGWTKQIDGSQSFMTYTSKNGLKEGDQQDFIIKFFAYHDATAPNPDTFAIVGVTTDRNNATCTSVDTIASCLSHIIKHGGSVQMHSENIGVSNFNIRPNPTQGTADISFDMHTQERVVLTVLDVLGHEVTTLNSKIMPEGTYHIPYTMNNLLEGTYYIRMQTPLGIITKKLVLMK